MLNHGNPLIVVSRRLGRSKVSVTSDIHARLIPEMQENAAKLINDLITPLEIQLHRGEKSGVSTSMTYPCI